ncbi:MAG: FliH/SctL family protein [Atribacterota bacterium]
MSNLYKRVCLVPISVLVGESAKEEHWPTREQDGEGEELQKERERIIAQAELEARELLARAQNAAEAIKSEAWEEGWKKGLQEGREAGKEEIRKIFDQKIVVWEKWLAAIRESRAEILVNLGEPILEFSFALARKIIGREIEREPFIEAIVERALQKLSNRERVLVRVNRNDYVRIKEMKEELLRRIDGLGYLEIQEDPRVEEGGCIVETVFGNIDAQIETQLLNLREELLKVVREENHD